MPEPVVAELQAGLAKVLALPEVKEKLAAVGREPFGSTAEQFAALVADDLSEWAKIVKDSGAVIN